MKSGVVSSEELSASGRWDAGFHLLRKEHGPLVDELMEKFDAVELVQLATDMPFDESAANAVFARLHRIDRSGFMKHIGKPKDSQDILGNQRWKRTLATYCAAASQYAMAKGLEEILELSKKKLEKLKHLQSIKTLASSKGATLLAAALVNHTGKDET